MENNITVDTKELHDLEAGDKITIVLVKDSLQLFLSLFGNLFQTCRVSIISDPQLEVLLVVKENIKILSFEYAELIVTKVTLLRTGRFERILREAKIGDRLEITLLDKFKSAYQLLKAHASRKIKIQPDLLECDIVELCASLASAPKFDFVVNELLDNDCIEGIVSMASDIVLVQN